jgi:hypothetical protein
MIRSPQVVRLVGASSLLVSPLFAGTTWDGGGGDDNWSTANNWDPDGSPSVGSTVDLTFAGAVRLTSNNDYTAWDDFRSLLFASGAGSFTLTGNSVDLFGKIEIILYRVEEETFRVECWRSFAEYAFGMLAEGAEDASL